MLIIEKREKRQLNEILQNFYIFHGLYSEMYIIITETRHTHIEFTLFRAQWVSAAQ